MPPTVSPEGVAVSTECSPSSKSLRCRRAQTGVLPTPLGPSMDTKLPAERPALRGCPICPPCEDGPIKERSFDLRRESAFVPKHVLSPHSLADYCIVRNVSVLCGRGK